MGSVWTAVSTLAADVAPIEVQTPTTLLGAFAIGITVLAAVVVFLFRQYQKANDQLGVERSKLDTERARCEAAEAKLAAGFELRARELAVAYAKDIREGEAAVREEFAAALEKLSAAQKGDSDRLFEILSKLTDRLTAVRGDRGGRYER